MRRPELLRPLLAVGLLLFAAPLFAQADGDQAISPQQRELATSLAQSTLVAQARQMYSQQKALIESLQLPPEMNSMVALYLSQVSEVLQRELSDPALQRDLMHLFAQHFTFDEMQELQRFFRSHTGQKFLDKMPELLVDSGVVLRRRATAILPQLDSFTRQLLENVEQYESGSSAEQGQNPGVTP